MGPTDHPPNQTTTKEPKTEGEMTMTYNDEPNRLRVIAEHILACAMLTDSKEALLRLMECAEDLQLMANNLDTQLKLDLTREAAQDDRGPRKLSDQNRPR
jgi:hypothetical protein